ncbi:YqgE/AlgH family protein [Myroides ceti]|uniref:UPF0301 protein QW060_12865 n=1 Tax=Paenimyroides ceti TaxID=395087 RepID=A0ABT8CVH2_9FLAO|nr:YqgE/AlgH family protein [Paenimyroides ceti]MDN3708001.1 YqgE/AlgH family protein [Paenimyroides ceti]
MNVTPHKGNLLIAAPNALNDADFSRSVVLLTEHSEKGSVGFILNKPSDLTISDILPEITKDFPIYLGGPVENENLYFIHNIPHIIKNSIEISDGIFWGGDFNILVDLLKNDEINKTNIKFFLGYSGWEADQLEEEIDIDFWVVSENSEKLPLFHIAGATIWKDLLMNLGEKYVIWANAPEDPIMN